MVVRTDPANFTDNVSADLRQISVTFDRQMMNRSWSWTRLDRRTFPKMVGRPRYDVERKTCTLGVKLKPGTVYFVGINYNPLESPPGAPAETRAAKGFKSTSGKVAKPYALVFATADVMGRAKPIPEEMTAKAKNINSVPEPTSGQGIEGTWLGTLKTPAFKLRVVFKISKRLDGTLSATLDSPDQPDQGAQNIAADKVTFRNGRLHVEVKSIMGVFDGKMQPDGSTIEGQWKQAGQSMPLVLKRSEEVPKGPTSDQGINGTWLGTLKVAKMELRVVLRISKRLDGALNAMLNSPDQGAQNIAADKVTFKNKGSHVEVKSIMGSFDGRMKADGSTIEGQWRQGGQSMPLVLKRSDEIPGLHRLQEPKRPYPYDEEEVVCENKTDGVKLGGTLTLPRSQGQCPAVLLISGSGPHDRNGAMMVHTFLVLADHLTRQGIAVLRVDDRGAGVSTGDCFEATSEDLAGDVLAGIEYLKSRKEISTKQIGLIGHSEGGIIAPMVAVRSTDVAFIVMMAGTGLTGEEVLYLRTTLLFKALGVSDDVVAAPLAQQEKLFAIIKEEKDNAVAARKIRELLIGNISKKLSEEEKETLEAMEAAMESQFKPLLSPWFRFFLTYDPKPTLSKVRCPVLAIVGEKDLQVGPKENLQAIEGALKAGGNARYMVKELANLNHLFQTAETGSPAEYEKIEETISPDALSLISRWIRQTVKDEHPGSDVEPLVSEDVGPDEEWEYPYFSSAIRSRNAVKFKITGVTDDAIEDVVNDRLRRAGAQGRNQLLEIFWNRDGTTLNVMLSPVADVDGLVKKIDFGTVVARRGRRILVEAKKQWTDEDFRFGPDPERTVRLKIIGVTDSATEEAIKEKLKETMSSSGFYPLGWSKMAGTVTADFAPVDDVEAFVKKIDFVGTVTSIRGRRVEVKVGGAAR
ncbi:MAG: alpha/beta fold hydrolase [Planctomycetota bacterium]|jgi:pimeloyl-ACP methyl ester carboxylesterase